MGWKGIRYRVKIRFQEILALVLVIPFLVFTVLLIFGRGDMELLRLYSPLIMTILGGYFGQGAIALWRKGEIEEIVEEKDKNLP